MEALMWGIFAVVVAIILIVIAFWCLVFYTLWDIVRTQYKHRRCTKRDLNVNWKEK